MEAKMTELQKMKEELERAKDDAMQSWLDSRPLIDELEKLQSILATAKNQSTMSSIAIPELESQLETANMCIKTKMEDELKVRAMMNEINQALDQSREEMEQIKLETDEERQGRSRLRQVLRLRRQTLQTLQLTLTAIRLDSEAFSASTAETLRYIGLSEMDNASVQLTLEEYDELTRRAEEEISLADWQSSVSMEQRLVAEASQYSALRRLEEIYSDNKSRKRNMEDEITRDGNATREAEEEGSRIRVGAHVNNRQIAFPKARAKFIAESSRGNFRPQRISKRRSTNVFLEKAPSFQPI
ncbi:hypothetical protein F0562_003892 [Nyssa sinensis]|uniref:Uncharacterized protein n=1 Tax=Nyssa sinensis TaxID=561372 RepID=A0A5J5BX51_9ASTE|nr:hypothetical protein F0562_003892 [Nyssa sinensis]